jgi:WS/DGAT/MGAT family acyltransferase
MGYTHYDRLTALDAAFLDLESPSVHMHVGSVGIFDAAPLTLPDGGLDMAKIRALAGPALRRHTRFRQRLVRVPLFGRPVWVDDPRFNLEYHLRHTSLPEPGDERLLKRLAGRIFSQKLDRGKPLWEMWCVEGLEGDLFAVITKVHHCMIDGISGADLMAAFIRSDGETGDGGDEDRWLPRPAPGEARLLAEEVVRRATVPARMGKRLPEALLRPRALAGAALRSTEAVAQLLASGFRGASPTPLNVGIGPHRRFDWTRFDMGTVKEVKERLGGTVNDVVLTVVAGAMRRFLRGRGVAVDELDFRVLVPVSTRTKDQRGKLGNRVALMTARLPVNEDDPQTRFELVSEQTARLKASRVVEGGEILEELSDWTGSGLLAEFGRLGAATLSYNMVVTNVPGPSFPVFLAGARMLEIVPLVPLYSNQALGVALFSYDESLFWGFNADWDGVPDLHDLVRATEGEFETLRKL